jgi:3-hexulose-6-phosphate synthase
MKLQVAFDMTDLDKALVIAQQVAPYASIIEIGSILIYQHGIKAIETFREKLPTAVILADTKIVDRAKQAVSLIANAGADIMTVMAGTSKEVIHAACTAAHNQNKQVMIDLLDACSLGQSALEAKSLGVNSLLFHKSHEEEDPLVFLDKWQMVRGNTTLPIFISGKITRDVLDKIKSINPDGVVIGKGIIDAADPASEARFFAESLGLHHSS